MTRTMLYGHGMRTRPDETRRDAFLLLRGQMVDVAGAPGSFSPAAIKSVVR